MRVAKERGIATMLVGHVTKEGSLAGPRVLEHLVDCVLSFEGERERTYRTLRALKNRFGSTNEVGVFEMRDSGLVEVEDASARFVAEATRAPGSVVLCAMEGSRPLLVEVQALVAPSELVPPRRVANGVDRNRLALVLAVLARHAGHRGSARATSSCPWPAACAWTSRAPTSRSRWRSRRAAKGIAPAPRRPAGRLRRARPDGRAAPRRARRPAARRGAEVRPEPGGPSDGRRAHAEAGPARGLDGRGDGIAKRPAPGRGLKIRCISRKTAQMQGLCPVELGQCRTPGTRSAELEARQEPRLVRALEMVAPGTAVRGGTRQHRPGADRRADLHRGVGGAQLPAVGGVKLDVDYTPALLYQLAKMDGAIILASNGTKILWANVQLMPDPTILSLETGTRHRTAERVSKQTDALVIAISAEPQRRLALPRRRQVHPRGHPRRARQGQPGARHARQVPQPPRPGLHPPHRARVRGRRARCTTCSPCSSAPSSSRAWRSRSSATSSSWAPRDA